MNTRTMKHAQATPRWLTMTFWLLAAAGLWWMSPTQAHEGHDHAGAAAKELATGSASALQLARFVVASDDFELVGVLMKDHLLVYLDDVNTNAPIKGAQLLITSAAFSGSAVETADGVYRLPLVNSPAVGRHALTLSIDTADRADLLTAAIEVKPAVAVQAAGDAGSGSISIGRWVAGGAVLMGIALSLLWARRRPRPTMLN